MKKIIFITPEDARFGFRLSAVAQIYAAADSITTTLERLVTDKTLLLVAIDERLYSHLDRNILDGIERRWPGIIIVLPAPEQLETVAEDYFTQLITKAIGYHVRLQP